MNRGSILQRIRTGGLLLALFALTFKAMLPPGFMLETGGDRIAITLCSGGEVSFDPATGEIEHEGGSAPADNAASQHCPFAFTSAQVLVAPAFEPQAPTPIFIADAAPVRQAIGEHDATGPPLPARGPPITT